MSHFTQQQASDAYDAIPADGIKKRVNDQDSTKGSRYICFTLNTFNYQVKLYDYEAAMDATAQEVKDAFIAKLTNEYYYTDSISTYTESTESKV